MEYFIKDQSEKLLEQRNTLICALSELNENLPNYSIKVNELSLQISNIDAAISHFMFNLKDIEMQKLSNDLAIKTQPKD